jgi:recombination protein RecT
MSTTTNAVVPVVTQVQQAMKREDRAQMLDTLLAGSGITPDRFMAVVLNSIVRSPDLQTASLESILDSVRVAATLRLEPTGILGEGYIVKYKNTAQFEAGYRGLMKLARRSGQIDTMDSQVVYAADEFQIELGTEPRILHRPSTEGERGNFRGAYAYARLTNGELVIEWMTMADLESVRKSSRNSSGEHSPWVNHPGEMYRKTVIKRLMKRLPLGTDGELALTHEAELDSQEQPARQPSPQVTDIRKRLGWPTEMAEKVATGKALDPTGEVIARVREQVESAIDAPAYRTSDVGQPGASGDNVTVAPDDNVTVVAPNDLAAISDLTAIADAVFEGDVLTAMPIEVSAALPVTPDGEILDRQEDDPEAVCGAQSPFDADKSCVRERGHKGDKGGHRDDSGLIAWPVAKS